MKFIQTLFILFLCTSILSAQGWKRTTGGNADDPCKAVVQMEDEGYVLVGDAESFGDDRDRDVYVVRYDLNGNQQWTQFYDEGISEFVNDAVVSPKGEILIVGDIEFDRTQEKDAYLIKINEFGDFKWSKRFGAGGEESFYSIVNSNDNGFVMAGFTNSFGNRGKNMYIVKVDATGEEVWSKNYGGDVAEEALSVVAVEDGYVMAGYVENSSRNRDFYVVKVDEAGDLLWEETYGSQFEYEEALDIVANDAGELFIGGNIESSAGPIHIIKTNNEGIEIWRNTYSSRFIETKFSKFVLAESDILIAGSVSIREDNSDFYLLKVNERGTKLWDNHFGDEETMDFSYDIIETMDGGFAIVGGSSVFFDFLNNNFLPLDDFVLVKTDALGNINSNRIEGRIFYDVDEDGTFSAGDIPLEDWPIEFVSSDEEEDFFTVSDGTGNYNVTVGTGRYVASVLNQNENYWTLSRNNVPSFFSTTYDTIRMVDFPVTADLLCPYVEVGVSAPSLSICNEVNYTVSYCNIGTAESGDFFIDVEFDEAIEVQGAELPFAIQTDGSYRFDLSSLGVGVCGDFVVNAAMACEGFVTGQAHTVRATVNEGLACLEPDPDWDMASLEVSADCDEEEETVIFRITNVGTGNMDRASKVTIGQEDIIVFSAPVRLDATRQEIIEQEAEGKTTRIIVEQVEGHPGRSFPTVAVEGCGEGEGVAQIRTGFVTMFPEDDADPFVAIDVQENLEDASGTMLRAYPRGYREENFIETGRDLVYHIQFQNLGEEELRHVVIRDTLPEELDISTIEIEASSHEYDFEIYENRILRFTFDKLSLPSINEDEAASKGFVKFRVQQMPNLAKGTVITNQALISTNFKKPFLTNKTKHTLGGALLDFVEISEFVSTEETEVEGISVELSPNPFIESALFKIEGWNGKAANLQIFDATGKLLQTQSFQADQLLFNRDHLSSGMYYYRVELKGQLLNAGKLVIQ
ncbi:MAG: T9SS type A sorting domain-containing protein [Bacteroidota bacterium]